MAKRRKSQELDIVDALRLVLEAGKFESAAQDVLQRAIDHIEAQREMILQLDQRINDLQAANMDLAAKQVERMLTK